MPGHFVADQEIERARDLARRITQPILALIHRHTTVSIERTVLRLLGLSGAGPRGVPLANLMVDRLQSSGLLGKGAAYWYGRAVHLGAKSPLEAVERLAVVPSERLAPLSPELEANLRQEVRAEVIAVIRSPAQSLLDYVPHGATTEGYGGTYATQENFRIMREALDAESRKR